jgi:hypothetical protein
MEMIRGSKVASQWLVAGSLAFAAGAADAQEAGRLPAGWKVRTDDPAQSVAAVQFEDMAPGWHLTTGDAHAILWHPDSIARGSYRIEVQTFLFDPGTRREGFGFFFGGSGLEGDAQRYSYFLIRQDGRFTVKRRNGAEAPTVKPWAEHAAIRKWADRGEHPNVGNVLAIDAGPETVVFSVNGTEVDRVPRAQLDVDGIVGLRVSHAVNVHVARITIQKK